jgi:hypothetical protein
MKASCAMPLTLLFIGLIISGAGFSANTTKKTVDMSQAACTITKTLNGPTRQADVNSGFYVDGSVLKIVQCQAIFHWVAVAAAKGCGGRDPDEGPWLWVTPVDSQGIGTQDPILIGEVSVPSANGTYPHDLDLTDKISFSSITRAVAITLAMGGDSCSNK